MQEPIQNAGHEVAIVIYDAPLPPRYFRFSKKFIRSVFVVVPLILGLGAMTLFFWGLGWRLYEAPRPKLPQVLSEQNSQLLSLEAEVNALKKSNTELTERLAATPSTTGAEDRFLLGIKKPYGMQDLTKENRVSLDQYSLEQGANKTSFKFQIVSSMTENKVLGHILVFLISDNVMMAYPAEANASLASGIKYSSGEPFSVSRLRPTNAEFLHRLTGESVKFLVYIFSREGDLLLQQESPSFKVEPKS